MRQIYNGSHVEINIVDFERLAHLQRGQGLLMGSILAQNKNPDTIFNFFFLKRVLQRYLLLLACRLASPGPENLFVPAFQGTCTNGVNTS